MALQPDSQTSFRRGMRDSASPTEYAKDELASLLNGRPSRVGNSIERRNGSRQTHADELNSGADGLGALEYSTATRARHLVVMVGDAWYNSSDDGETWIQIGGASGYATTAWSHVLMRVGAENRVIGANEGDHPISWAGTGDVVELSNWPAGIKHLAVMGDRLWGSDGSINVQGSKVGDPATIATAEGGLFVKCQAHDTDPQIMGIWTHGLVLLVWKRETMGYIEGYGFNTISAQTGERGLSRSVGCIAHRSIAPAGAGGVCWLSERGLEYLPANSLSPELVSSPIQGFMNTIDWEAIRTTPGLPCALWWQIQEEYWCAVPTLGATQNTHIIVFRPAARGRPPAIWIFQGSASIGRYAVRRQRWRPSVHRGFGTVPDTDRQWDS